VKKLETAPVGAIPVLDTREIPDDLHIVPFTICEFSDLIAEIAVLGIDLVETYVVEGSRSGSRHQDADYRASGKQGSSFREIGLVRTGESRDSCRCTSCNPDQVEHFRI